MYEVLMYSHSILRWIIVISILLSVIYAYYYLFSGKNVSPALKIVSQAAVISLHTQLLLGLILYFISPKVIFSALSMKVPITRFFLVEHLTAMLVAIIIITIGHVKFKKSREKAGKLKAIAIYYTIGILIILAAIPWPFYNFGTRWL
jgi:hypothetical protein